MNEKICPHCQARMKDFEEQSYFSKLVRSLHHPEATTRMRAAYILGEIGDKRAIEPLAQSLRNARKLADLFFLKEIAIALGKIGGDEAEKILGDLSKHPSFIVKSGAQEALHELQKKSSNKYA